MKIVLSCLCKIGTSIVSSSLFFVGMICVLLLTIEGLCSYELLAVPDTSIEESNFLGSKILVISKFVMPTSASQYFSHVDVFMSQSSSDILRLFKDA